MNGPNAIVSGYAGFLGRYVTASLREQGWYVVGIGEGGGAHQDDFGDPDAAISGRVSAESLTSALDLCRTAPLALIHAAGSGSVVAAQSAPATDFRKSVVSVVDSLTFLRDHSPTTKFIFPSSASVYGQTPPTKTAETAPLVPVSIYGTHKKVCEDIISGYSRVFGLNAAIIRFFSLYGPGLRKQLIWDICEKAANPPHSIVLDGDGSDVRDFLHARDAAELIRLAALADHAGVLVVNGGTGVAASVREIGTILAKLYAVLPPSFSATIRAWDPSYFLADMDKPLKTLGFQQTIKLEDGLAGYVRWHHGLRNTRPQGTEMETNR